MNLHDFESELRRASLRRAPEDWKGQILSTARSSAEPSRRRPAAARFAVTSGWRAWLWPHPAAWASVACAWAAIFAIQGTVGRPSMHAEQPISAQQARIWTAWSSHLRWAATLDELESPAEQPAVPDTESEPRSEHTTNTTRLS